MTDHPFNDFELIHAYTRAQAIADGVLVDVTAWASAETGFHGGFTIPVAVTRAVWADIEAIPPSKRGVQDVRGRAHDVLWMAALAARRGGSETRFSVIMPVGRRKRQTYRLVCGPGDAGEPVISIMQPHEH